LLLALCRVGKLYEIEDWIKAGKSLRVANGIRKSPLETAIETGFHSLIFCLARNETRVEVKNRALTDAVRRQKLELVELLTTYGAEVTSVPFVEVLRSWEPRIMRFFLERGADAVSGSPFAVAFGEKIRTALRAFVDYKAANPSLAAELQEQSDRALRHFCYEGDLKWVSLLLWAGANPRSLGPTLDEKYADDPECHTTGFLEACSKGDVEVLKRLKPDGARDNLCEFLASAAASGEKEALIYLFDLGSTPNGKANGGSEAMDRCLWRLNFEDTRAFMEKRVATKYGVSKSLECIQVLVERGALWSPNDRRDMNSLRQALYRCEPAVTVELMKLMARNRACPESMLEQLLDTPRMRAHLSQLGMKLMGNPPVTSGRTR
jgi:hypothetical protein